MRFPALLLLLVACVPGPVQPPPPAHGLSFRVAAMLHASSPAPHAVADSIVADVAYTLPTVDAFGPVDSLHLYLLAPGFIPSDSIPRTLRKPFSGSEQFRQVISGTAPPGGAANYTVVVCGFAWRRQVSGPGACSNQVDINAPPPGPLGLTLTVRRLP